MTSQARRFVLLGAASAFIGVGAGAFGAHWLRARVGADLLPAFETAARYQMYHALALVGVAWVHDRMGSRAVVVAGWLFVAGTILFSGSLYLLVFTGARGWGAVTPFGGVAFLAGWIALGVGAIRYRVSPS